jgi:hypothetical protein
VKTPPDNSVFGVPPPETEPWQPPWPDGCPQPGLYYDVAYDDYVRWEAINATCLKHGSELSPKHMRQSVQDGTDTRSRKFGRGIHCRLLEGSQAFAERFPIAAPCTAELKAKGREGQPCGVMGR